MSWRSKFLHWIQISKEYCYPSVRLESYRMKRISPDTVSGGNDVELVNILNQCIFQWAVLNSAQVNIGKIASEFDKKYEWAAGLDWDALGRGCAGQLKRTGSLIASESFSKSLDSVLDAAKKKLAKE
jgi:hypothetical protein